MRNEIDMTWQPDWWSRLMALGSLIVAGVALWFAKENMPQPSETTPVDVAQVRSLVERMELEALASVERERRFDQLCSRLENLPGSVQPATHIGPITDKLPADLVDDDSALDEDAVPLEPSEQEVAEYGTPAKDVPTEASGAVALDDHDLAENQVADGTNADAAGTTPANSDPANSLDDVDDNGLAFNALSLETASERRSLLKVVEKSLRPLANESAATMTVRNVGNVPALISRVTFSPSDIVDDVSTEIASRPLGTSTDSAFVLAFSPDDNVSAETERQGKYTRELDEPYTLSAGAEVSVFVAIDDPAHLGYGLMGVLTLEFNATESISEIAAIAFVGKPGS